jgi:hypothetical protein
MLLEGVIHVTTVCNIGAMMVQFCLILKTLILRSIKLVAAQVVMMDQSIGAPIVKKALVSLPAKKCSN